MPTSPERRAERTALAAAALLALCPTRGSALDVELKLDDDDALVSRTECTNRSSQELEIDWDLGSSTGDSVEILASDSSGCSEDADAATTEVLVDGLDTSQTTYPGSGDSALTISDVLGASGKSAGSCDGEDFRIYVCVRLLDSSGSEVATGSAALKFQLERPPPPVSIQITPGEEALHVSWTAGTAADGATASSETYRVFASAGGSTVPSGETGDTSLRLGGLENGTTYQVWVVAYSEAGNESEASESSTGTPVAVDDFYEVYRRAGGDSQGGCGSLGAGTAGLMALALGLLGFLLRPGRRSRGRRAGLGVGLLLLAAPVRAQEPRAPDESVSAEAPLRGSVELGAWTYRPSIDSEFHGASRPYADVFGGRVRPMFQLAASWAALSGGPGRLEIGVRTGYFRATGHGRLADGSASADGTTFTIVPTSLVLTGRAHLARLGVPLEPYARLGLERYNWWVTDGSDRTSKRGATHGWSASAGLALSLTVLDPESKRLMEADAGMKDLSLYADVTWARVDGFGRAWNLSPRGVSVGGGLLLAF